MLVNDIGNGSQRRRRGERESRRIALYSSGAPRRTPLQRLATNR